MAAEAAPPTEAPAYRDAAGARNTSRRAKLDEAAEIHHGDAVGDVRDHGEIVGDEHVGKPEFALQVGEQIEHVAADRHVERGHDLVAYDKLRTKRQRPRDQHALLLAARKLVRIALGGFMRQPDTIQRLARPRQPLASVPSRASSSGSSTMR